MRDRRQPGWGTRCAAALAGEGYRVYAAGRTVDSAKLLDGIVRLHCDHLRDQETEPVFARIAEDSNGLDILVNSAWGGYESMVENGRFTWGVRFWEQPLHRWTSMMDAGVRIDERQPRTLTLQDV